MTQSRVFSELAAGAGGAAIGAAAGVILGSLTSFGVGLVVGIVLGLVAALSIRRGRGQRGWADDDGESRVGQDPPEAGASRAIPKGSRSPADLPVVPGMSSFGTGSAGPGA